MREPERIGRVLEKLRVAWEAHGDLRLGQLLINLDFPYTPKEVELFYREDDEWEAKLDEFNEKK